MFKNQRDLLALVLILTMVLVWILQGNGYIILPGEIIGASITIMTLIVQFYFRKSNKPELPTISSTVTTDTTTITGEELQ